MQNLGDNKSFCPAPWNAIYLEPNGRIESCCVAKNNIGNVKESDIETIIAGQRNIEIKKKMLVGEPVAGCRVCHDKKQSLQRELVKRFPPKTQTSLYQSPSNFNLQYIDARWSNVCNLACVYCGPTLSSMWAEELGQPNRVERQDKVDILNYFLDHIDSLEYIYLAGGEPLLMKENEIIVKAIARHNPTCRVLVNTNLLNVDTTTFLDLTRLVNCEWLISVDAMREQYEYIRYPGRWFVFEQNLAHLKTLVDIKKIKFNMVLMNINARSLWDTVDWLAQLEFLHSNINVALYNNAVVDGPFDIRYLPIDYQQQVLEQMNQDPYQNMPGWENCVDYVGKLVYNKSNMPLKHLKTLDQKRGLDSTKVFPHFYQSIESTHEL